MKFVSFVIKNKDFPFAIKRKVMEAALLSSILYASESWIGTSIDVANNAYMTVIKCLLGVRTSTRKVMEAALLSSILLRV